MDSVTTLFQAGHIGQAEVEAADLFYRNWALAKHGVAETRENGPICTSGGDGFGKQKAMMLARDALVADEAALDPLTLALLRAVVIEGKSFRSLTDGSTMGTAQVQGATITALRVLSWHHGNRRGRVRSKAVN